MAANEISIKDYIAQLQSATPEITQEAKDLLVQAMKANLLTASDQAPVDSGYLRDQLRDAANNLQITDEPGVFKVRSEVEVYDDKVDGKNKTHGFPYGIWQNAIHKTRFGFLQKGLDSAKNLLGRMKDISIIKVKGGE